MASAQTRQRTRGPGRLVVITYPLLASLTGLSEHTVRAYGQGADRQFDPRDPLSVARWLVRRRSG